MIGDCPEIVRHICKLLPDTRLRLVSRSFRGIFDEVWSVLMLAENERPSEPGESRPDVYLIDAIAQLSKFVCWCEEDWVMTEDAGVVSLREDAGVVLCFCSLANLQSVRAILGSCPAYNCAISARPNITGSRPELYSQKIVRSYRDRELSGGLSQCDLSDIIYQGTCCILTLRPIQK